jgi:hypothetical protein
MQERNAKLVALVAVLSAAVLAIGTELASASGTSTGREIHLYEAQAVPAAATGNIYWVGRVLQNNGDFSFTSSGGTATRGATGWPARISTVRHSTASSYLPDALATRCGGWRSTHCTSTLWTILRAREKRRSRARASTGQV